MSSCLSEADVKKRREEEIKERAKVFLKDVVVNLCMLEGTGGRVDTAFKVDRPKLIVEVLREIIEELEA